MDERITQFAPFVDRARCFRRGMAWYSAGEGKLAEEPFHARFIFADCGIDFGIGALQIGVGHHARPAMAGAANIDHIGVALLNNAVEMRIDEIEAGCRAPMAEKPRLDVLRLERFAQQGIFHQINLADGKIIRRAPVTVDE